MVMPEGTRRNAAGFKNNSCMGGISSGCCCGFCTCFEEVSFDWRRRRYVWRATVFYNVVAGLICFGVLLTTTLMTLIDSRSFFWNYRCGGKAVRLISLNFAGMIGVTGLTGLAALLMARLTDTFSNYTMHDMMAVGKCSDRLGLLVKWVPWFTAVTVAAWILFNLVNLIWILAAPKDWCSRRWSETGIQAVTNCRLWYTGKAPCIDRQAQSSSQDKETVSCNDGPFLEKRQFFMFTPDKKDTDAKGSAAEMRCSFEAMQICLTYLRYFSSSASADSSTIDWNSDSLQFCLGKKAAGMPPEAFQQPEADTSDLYKYVCTYVVCWNLVTLIIVCLFYYVKFSSNFESMFYQPPRKEHVVYRIIRPLTPWTS